MDKLCEIKDDLIDVVYDVITTQSVENIDASELGEIIDVIKDIAEFKYYMSIVEAMEKGDTSSFRDRMYYSSVDKDTTLDTVMSDIDKLVGTMDTAMLKAQLTSYISKL